MLQTAPVASGESALDDVAIPAALAHVLLHFHLVDRSVSGGSHRSVQALGDHVVFDLDKARAAEIVRRGGAR